MRLLLEEVIESGYRPVATLEGRSYRVGRDLTTDVPISSDALSRQHGLFVPFPSGWIFKDLGSTNGSWHNGQKLDGQRFVPLKEGDFLQLADYILRVKYQGQAGEQKGPRLMVVKNGEPLKEILFTQYNASVAVGGATAQLEIDGYIDLDPAVEFEYKGVSVYARPGGGYIRIICNGEELTESRELQRGDSVVVGEYELIYVDTILARPQGEPRPFPISPTPQPQIDLTEVSSGKTAERSIEAESRPQVFSPVHTVAIKPDSQKIWRFGETPQDEEDDPWTNKVATRAPAPVADRQPFFATLFANFDFERMSDAERRLVFGIAFFLCASILLFLIWLIFL